MDDGQLTRNEVQMAEYNPNVIVLAGPNGAGKSTAAPSLLQDLLDVGVTIARIGDHETWKRLNEEYGHEH